MVQENLTNSTPTASRSVSSPPKGKMTFQITGVFDLIGEAFEVYKSKFWKLVGMMLIPVLGAIPLIIVLILFAGLSYLSMDSGSVLTFLNIVLGILGIIGVIIFIIIAISAQAGMYIIIKNEKEFSIKDAFLQGKSMAGQFFLVNVEVGLFVLLWSLLLVIPGIIMAIYYAFATWILVDMGIRGGEAIKKSKELVKEYWWAVFGRLVAIQILLMLITGVPTIFFEETSLELPWYFISQLISFLAAPLVLIYAFKIYSDLKNIKGGISTSTVNKV